MNKIVKQSVGIDVAQNELVVSFGRMYEDWRVEVFAFKTFQNDKKGFASLVAWANKLAAPLEVCYVMEATGVYHERLAYYLDDQGCYLSIVLPNKISNYFKTLEVKTITDKTSSEVIARFGVERRLDRWKRPNPVFRRLRQLTREREQLIVQRTAAKNQLHAEQCEAEGSPSTISRLKKQIKFFDIQEGEIRKEMDTLIKQNQEVHRAVQLMTSIPGIGVLTAATVLGETNGFELIRSKRQLASYAGFDIREKQSGTSVKGKPRISKRGNKHLRKAMYLPALAAIGHDEGFKGVFVRLVGRHGIKMKGAVAVQRKLLEMTFTIYKSKTPYNKNYVAKQVDVVAVQN